MLSLIPYQRARTSWSAVDKMANLGPPESAQRERPKVVASSSLAVISMSLTFVAFVARPAGRSPASVHCRTRLASIQAPAGWLAGRAGDRSLQTGRPPGRQRASGDDNSITSPPARVGGLLVARPAGLDSS